MYRVMLWRSVILAPVVQADKSLSRGIKCIGWSTFYPLDDDLSTEQTYPLFEQLGPGLHIEDITLRREDRDFIFEWKNNIFASE